MKREAFGHTKLKRFCRLFDVPVYQAVGILETLWHITAIEAPRGDIGHLTDEQIALGLDWRGAEKPLIDALLVCHWLDPDPIHRLLVHDWPHHCDDSVHRKLARAKLYFADNSVPNWSRLSGRDRAEASGFYECLPKIGVRAPEMAKRAPEMAKRAPYLALPRPAPPKAVEPIAAADNARANGHSPPPPILQTLQGCVAEADFGLAEYIWNQSLAGRPMLTDTEVCAEIQRVWPRARRAENPLGFLRDVVPKNLSTPRKEPATECRFCRLTGAHQAECPTLKEAK